jgi:hypothetical protein
MRSHRTLGALALALAAPCAQPAELCPKIDYAKMDRAAIAETWCRYDLIETLTKKLSAGEFTDSCVTQKAEAYAAMGGTYPDCNAYLRGVRDREARR